MKTYELTQENVKMIVNALDFSIDNLTDAQNVAKKHPEWNRDFTTEITKLTTLKNYLEQY